MFEEEYLKPPTPPKDFQDVVALISNDRERYGLPSVASKKNSKK